MPLGHTTKVSRSTIKSKVNKTKLRSSVKKRKLSSEKESDMSTNKDCSGDEGWIDTHSQTLEAESLSEEMDCIRHLKYSDWQAIMAKIQESSMWRGMEESLYQVRKDLDEIKSENNHLKTRLQHSEGRVTRLERKLGEANEKILELTTRSMRDNLIVKNLPEQHPGNNPGMRQGPNFETQQEIESKLMSVFKNKLKMSEVDLQEVKIERCHRFGKPRGGNARNIVVKLNSKGKAKVLANARNLPRDDPIKISEQFPAEINNRRNKLWPQYIQARQAGKIAKFNGDKLIIDKKMHDPPKDRVMDINMDVTKQAMSMKPKHTSVISVERNHYQGHLVPIKSKDDVIPALQSLCADPRVAGASHLTYAYKTGREDYYISNYEDDGEPGAGREVMEVLDAKKCYNYLVAVSTWSSGKHHGYMHLDRVRNAAEEAFNLLV